MLQAVNPSPHMVTAGELVQYGAMGTIIHKMAEMALKKENNPTKLWEDCKKEWVLVQNGSLKLDPSKANPQGFISDYAEDFNWNAKEIEVEMFDDSLLLKGTTDLVTEYKGELAIVDWKTARSYSAEKKVHYFKQLSLYALMYKNTFKRDVKCLVIIPLNPNNLKGYGKPIVTDDILHYQELALKDLETFNKLYRT